MIGEKVSHYKIIEKLGGGGMGLIYKAQDLKLDRFVALKFLPPVFSMNEEFKQNIIEEAKIAATLDHPNICTIYEVGETEDDQIFIAMACYEGETLRKKIQNNTLPREDIESTILQIAKGLEAAHNKGIVHRDIKPENIFITKQNEVKILDFGVAKIAGDYSVMDADKVKGTLAYMSPEQISGMSTDNRTDIWAFGVLLYELLTGEKPFSSQFEQSALYSITNDEPDLSIIQKKTELQYLKEIIAKCLEKKKEDRYKSFNGIILIFNKKISDSDEGKTKRLLLSILMSIIFGIIIILSTIKYFPEIKNILSPSKISSNRLAVLPFSAINSSQELNEILLLLQSLVVRNLTNYEHFSVIDPISLNGLIKNTSGFDNTKNNSEFNEILDNIDVDYYMNGSSLMVNNKNQVQINFVNVKNGEILLSENLFINEEQQIPKLASAITKSILNYFDVKSISTSEDDNVKPFIEGTNSIEALKAFLIACEHNYRMEKIEEEKYLRLAISFDSTFISPRIWLIPTLFYRGELVKAKKQLIQVKRLEANANRYEQIMIGWAEAFIENNIQNQISYLQMGLNYSPRNNIIIYNLAYLYYSQNQYNEAIKYLQETLDMKWNFSGAYSLMGFCLLKLNNYSRTIMFLEKSLSVKPIFDEIYLLLRIAHAELGDQDLSSYYDSLYLHNSKIKGTPLSTSLEYSAIIYLEFDQINYALNNYKELLSIEPDNNRIRERFGDLLISKSDTNSAINEYQTILKSDEYSTSLNLKLGKIHDSRKDTLNAIKYYSVFTNHDTTKLKEIIWNKIKLLSKKGENND